MTGTGELESKGGGGSKKCDKNLNSLKRKRSARKGVITRFLNEINKNLEPSKEELTRFLNTIERNRDEILTLDGEILAEAEEIGLDEQDYANLYEESELYSCQIEGSINEIRTRLDVLISQKEAEANQSFIEALKGSSVLTEKDSSEIRAKLPFMQVPFFYGDITKYQSFLEKFESLIGSKSYISDVDKFSYLLYYLKGPALTLVESKPAIGDSYKIALDLLDKNYNNKNEIINDLALKLKHLQRPKDNYEAVFKFYTEFECLLGQLTNNEVDLEKSAWFVQAIVFDCLPPLVKEIFQRRTEDVYPSLQFIRNNFPIVLSIYKACAPKKIETSHNKLQGNVPQPTQGIDKERKPNPPTLHSFNTVTSDKKLCKFCSSTEHSTTACSIYKTFAAREKRCEQLNICKKCTGSNHKKEECKTALKYFCKTCNSKDHVAAMCDSYNGTTKQKPKPNKQNQASDVKVLNSQICSCEIRNNTKILLPTITLNILQPNGTIVESRALMDCASQQSFISKSLVENLGLDLCKNAQSLTISSYIRDDPITATFDTVKLKVLINEEVHDWKVVVIENFEREKMVVPGLKDICDTLESLYNYTMADKHITSDTIDNLEVLIGADYIHLLQKGIEQIGDGIAFITPCGIAPVGDISRYNLEKPVIQTLDNHTEVICLNTVVKSALLNTDNRNQVVTSHYINSENSDHTLEEGLQQLWLLESVGIHEDDKYSNENQLMSDRFENTIKYNDNCYFVELPWKIDCKELDSNLNTAKGHLYRLINKLKKDHKIQQYDDIITEQLQNGFIEEVEHEPFTKHRCHYLTHRGVYRNDSPTTKLRIVYNCSLKDKNSVSLNDCLIEGPNLVSDLVRILLRFRLDTYAFQSDIRKAFLKIHLKNEYDKNQLRFLWFKDPHDLNQGFRTFRFNVLIFGANCSPSILALTIKHHLEQYAESFTVKFLKEQFFVDNLIGSTSTTEELFEIYQNSQQIMKAGNFELKEWVSNYPKLNSLIEKDGNGLTEPTKQVKTLGMIWNLDDNYDSLSTKSYNLNSEAKTKREILSESSKIFDPMGLFLPTTIRSRIFLQELWKIKVGWDECLPDNNQKFWKHLSKDLSKLQMLKVPRICGYRQKIQTLHVFADSSTVAYGCCAYLVSNEESNLIYSKGKIAPLSPKRTVPQLELLASSLAVKTISYLRETFSDVEIAQTYLWLDSQICLTWIRSNDHINCKNIFVKNRVREINEANKKLNIHFKYVSTKQNPADFITRGLSFRLLRTNKAWFKGPIWLPDDSKWPSEPINFTLNNVNTFQPVEFKEPIIDCNKYSNYYKLIKITTNCLKFISLCRRINKTEEQLLQDSLMYWLKYNQERDFWKELKYLRNPTKEKEIPSLVLALNLFIDEEGLIRCKGRINKCKLSYFSKNPILLHQHNHFTQLIVHKTHEEIHHMGVAQTLNTIRKVFWIPKGRRTVKSLIGSCITCRRIHARPFKTPDPPDLPEERVTLNRPFETTGIDYTGAVNVHFKDTNFKVYIVLYTCVSSRAISLDVVDDLTTESFLNSFKRFCAKHSTPTTIWTDNALYFKSGEKYLNKLYETNEVQNYATIKGVHWKYIPPGSPRYGSVWERNIQTVKNCLKKTIKKRKVELFDLITLLAEIENTVNNRPLTYLGDSLDEPEPLTPNHLLKGESSNLLPEFSLQNTDPDDPDYNINEIPHSDLQNKFKNLIKLKENFFKQWEEDYLTSLRERHKRKVHKAWENCIKIGDVVLLHSGLPRQFWSLGRVLELKPGDDGVTRVVKVKTAHGETVRDITLLYPLECGPITDINENGSNTDKTIDSNITPTISDKRPPRKTALLARELFQSKIKAGDL